MAGVNQSDGISGMARQAGQHDLAVAKIDWRANRPPFGDMKAAWAGSEAQGKLRSKFALMNLIPVSSQISHRYVFERAMSADVVVMSMGRDDDDGAAR